MRDFETEMQNLRTTRGERAVDDNLRKRNEAGYEWDPRHRSHVSTQDVRGVLWGVKLLGGKTPSLTVINSLCMGQLKLECQGTSLN
jgi:hypothetical protein